MLPVATAAPATAAPPPPFPSDELAVLCHVVALAASESNDSDPAAPEGHPLAYFFSSAVPAISFVRYAAHLQRHLHHGHAVFLGLTLMLRVTRRAGVPLSPRMLHRLLLASVSVAMKAHYDDFYATRYIAKVGGMQDPTELSMLESELLRRLGWQAMVSKLQLHVVRREIGRIAVLLTRHGHPTGQQQTAGRLLQHFMNSDVVVSPQKKEKGTPSKKNKRPRMVSADTQTGADGEAVPAGLLQLPGLSRRSPHTAYYGDETTTATSEDTTPTTDYREEEEEEDEEGEVVEEVDASADRLFVNDDQVREGPHLHRRMRDEEADAAGFVGGSGGGGGGTATFAASSSSASAAGLVLFHASSSSRSCGGLPSAVASTSTNPLGASHAAMSLPAERASGPPPRGNDDGETFTGERPPPPPAPAASPASSDQAVPSPSSPSSFVRRRFLRLESAAAVAATFVGDDDGAAAMQPLPSPPPPPSTVEVSRPRVRPTDRLRQSSATVASTGGEGGTGLEHDSSSSASTSP